MNVSIIGNSNCVFRNGMTAGVERFVAENGESVRNYSLGGSCCALHIYTLQDRYDELCEADVVILDSLVIDSFHWKRGIIRRDELLSLIDDMYALYSGLPAKVVSVFFPIEKYIGRYRYLPTYQAHLVSAKKYGIDVVDLYSLLPDGLDDYSGYFMQPSHIRLDIANEIGYRLAGVCSEIFDGKGERKPLGSPYSVISKEVLGELLNVDVGSSYYKASCYRLDRNVRLDSLAGASLVGVFHWNKTSTSKFVVVTDEGEDVVQFRSNYAFFEVLNSRRRIGVNTILRPGTCGEAVTQNPAGKSRLAEYDVPQIAGLLVKDGSEVSGRVVGNHSDLSGLLGNVFG